MPDYSLLIAGRLVPGDDTIEVLNPATEEVLALAPRASRAQLDAAVDAAAEAFPAWAATSLDERRAVLVRMADVLAEHTDELARLLTLEQGKPLRESRREVGGTVGFFRHAAGLPWPDRTVEDAGGRRIRYEHRPLGPVAAIIPWNFPLLTIAFKVPWALLAGDTVVLKPSPTTPLTALRFAELVAPLLPPGVLNVITDANELGDALTSHPRIRKVSFTGSTATGQLVMANAVATLKRLTLELGGNDCAIVLDDVDPVATAAALFAAAFANNGQVCLAIKRLYVHDAVYDAVCAALADLAEAARVGDGLDEEVRLGPVQNRTQLDKLLGILESARRDGTVIAGGTTPDGPGYFLRPTIVRDIVEGTRLVDEEQFGPILPVIRYSDVDDALQRANDTGFGLGASVWASDPDRAAAVAERIDAGTVWINRHADIAPHIPLGGAKSSGFGTEFSDEGLREFTQLRVVSGAA